MSKQNFDIIVLGAGMVGSLFVLQLKQNAVTEHLRIAVIDAEAVTLPAKDAAFELRVSSLTRASEALITEVGCAPALAALRHCVFTDMQVWDADGTGHVHFRASELGETHLGTLVENRILQAVLCERLWQLPGVSRFCPARWQRLERLSDISPSQRTDAGWALHLADGQVLTAPLVVGADGANSAVREAAGISTSLWDYQQRGLVCTVTTELPHQHTAWQRFLSTGPLAFLPLADAHHCSIVWTLPLAEADALLALSDEAFAIRLGQAFEHRLGAISAVSARAAFPLVARHAAHYVADGVALIGDAAHSIHPLAGQGVNLGLLDAAALATEIIAVVNAGLPASHQRALRRYSRARRGHNALIMHTMTGFERLFAAQNPSLRILRNAGMRAFSGSGLVKQWVMRAAMGKH